MSIKPLTGPIFFCFHYFVGVSRAEVDRTWDAGCVREAKDSKRVEEGAQNHPPIPSKSFFYNRNLKGTTEVASRAVIPTPPARPGFMWSNVVHEPNCRITADIPMWGNSPKGTAKNFGTKF